MSLRSFTTGTRQGNVRAPGALARLLSSKQLPRTAARAEQIHGVGVAIVPKLRTEKKFAVADGLLTSEAGQPLAIFTADCVPLFVNAAGGNVVGLLHAGWRGVRGNILAVAVRHLRQRWNIRSSDVEVWAGPSIGACCFEVQWDVARYFAKSRTRFKDRWKVDLFAALRAQAKALGVRWVDQKTFNGCTMHQSGYFSYRRDKTDKRQVSVIMKTL